MRCVPPFFRRPPAPTSTQPSRARAVSLRLHSDPQSLPRGPLAARITDPEGLSQAEGAKTIPAGESGTYIITTRMTGAAETGCQSRVFTLPLTAAIIANAV